ncbi:SMI1/KNR4 family protein [Stenotrophomonas sp.]|uniref:SMI1/KNR4 family protein n=1 Tax=Stenotrophomonas sp. TaxID=69392 RepID=UPI002FC65622
MHTLAEIERTIGQTFPPLFHQLDAADQLSWGAPHPQWSSVHFPRLQAAPPVLLYAQEYEPLPREQLHPAWEALTAEDHYNPLREDLHLLPFAQTGAGDHYCFWTNAPGMAEAPVVLVWHDDDRADVLAANLQDFLFRKMVEAVVAFDPSYSLLSSAALAAELQAWLGTHRQWLRADQIAALEALFARTDDIANARIDEAEAQAIVQAIIGFERLDASFAYVRD